jgi:hypothetical protein
MNQVHRTLLVHSRFILGVSPGIASYNFESADIDAGQFNCAGLGDHEVKKIIINDLIW